MTLDDPWEDLIGSLNSWADAREVSGGIEVAFVAPSGKQRVVNIVLTPEDWDEMAYNIGKESPDSVRAHLLGLREDEHFLVGDSGVELVPSPTREVPPNDFMPDPGGYWVTVDDAGNVQSRFDEDYSVWGQRLRILWDEGAGPVWSDGDGLLPDDPEWLRRALGLSDELIVDLAFWQGDMDAAHSPGTPLPRHEHARLNERGQELADRLQVEVGDAFKVSFRPDKVTYREP